MRRLPCPAAPALSLHTRPKPQPHTVELLSASGGPSPPSASGPCSAQAPAPCIRRQHRTSSDRCPFGARGLLAKPPLTKHILAPASSQGAGLLRADGSSLHDINIFLMRGKPSLLPPPLLLVAVKNEPGQPPTSLSPSLPSPRCSGPLLSIPIIPATPLSPAHASSRTLMGALLPQTQWVPSGASTPEEGKARSLFRKREEDPAAASP